MNPTAQIALIIGACTTIVVVTKAVTAAVVRMRQLQRPSEPVGLDARLERIEAAVEAIAIEVERAGELQRFTARLAAGSPSSSPKDA